MELEQVRQAIDHLRLGHVIVYPTETSYGIGADALNENAVKRIYEIKGRSDQKPISLICANSWMVEEYFVINKKERDLMNKYWPGPLTLLLEPKPALTTAKFLNSSDMNSKIGVRISKNSVARKLSEELGRPITAASANVSGTPDKFSAMDLKRDYEGRNAKPDFFLDLGDVPPTKLSTVAEVLPDGNIKVYRQGEIKL